MGGQTRKLKWSLDDLDLNKPIECLSRLIDDPEKLIDEVFKIAAKYLPKDIVPSSLKDIPTVELKKLCLEQLKKVERETLLSILTDGSNDLNEDADHSQINLNETKEFDESIASGSGLPRVTKDAEIQVEIHSAVRKEKDDDVSSKKIKRSKAESTSVSGGVEMTQDNVEIDEDPDTILDQAALEIRELELRAQAIRQLLKKHAQVDSAAQANVENQKESRKRQKTESLQNESTTAQKEVNMKDQQQNASSNIHPATEDHGAKATKVTSRLSRNPVSMVEEDEFEDGGSSSTEMRKGVRRKRSDESNIMIQLHNDSDDSIDRELKGE